MASENELTLKQIAYITGLSLTTLQRRRALDTFPKPLYSLRFKPVVFDFNEVMAFFGISETEIEKYNN